METFKAIAVHIQQRNNAFYLTKLRVKDLVRISYVAQRGVSNEEGAVQRILNRVRIAGVREFAEAGGDFPNSIVLNWTSEKRKLKFKDGHVVIPLEPDLAQIVDGQHRVAGLREGLKADSTLGNLEIPIAIYEGLTTKKCADIFLSINTEQKPVARSLVFDLYGVASGYVVDEPSLRAKDIADKLHNDENSPYYQLIKYPGPEQKGRGIALSTIVSTIKPLIEKKGVFEQLGIVALEQQSQVLTNWLRVLQDAYGNQWTDKDNVFLYASGFNGAIDFLKNKLLTFCNMQNAFDFQTMKGAMEALKDQLIWQKDVEGLQGRRSTSTISEMLTQVFVPSKKARKTLKV